jgi:hypothetical protein
MPRLQHLVLESVTCYYDRSLLFGLFPFYQDPVSIESALARLVVSTWRICTAPEDDCGWLVVCNCGVSAAAVTFDSCL